MNPMTNGSPKYAPLSRIVSLTRRTMMSSSNLLSLCTPHQRKLQTTIIQKDKDLTKVIAVAKSMEMAQQEVKFMKSNTLQQSTHEHTQDAVAKQQYQQYQPRPTNDHTSSRSNTGCKLRTTEIC